MNTTKESIQSVIRKLSDSNLDELNELGTRTADELSKLYPELQKLVHKTDLVNASKLPKLSEENYSDDNPPISLIYYSPKNELELTADIIYESSNLSLQELREVTSSWSYDKKAKILSTYCDQFTANKMRSRGALDKTQYTWDVISDYATFRDFQENPAFTVVARQPLNTRFGYSLPQDIDDAGLSDLYDQCFDISLSLHSELIQSNYINDAEYATLIGHKLRYQVTNNAESLLFNASHTTDRQRLNIEYDNLLREMVEMVTEVHPLIGASLKASNNNRQFSKSKSLGR
jgi:hypothetical protein